MVAEATLGFEFGSALRQRVQTMENRVLTVNTIDLLPGYSGFIRTSAPAPGL